MSKKKRYRFGKCGEHFYSDNEALDHGSDAVKKMVSGLAVEHFIKLSGADPAQIRNVVCYYTYNSDNDSPHIYSVKYNYCKLVKAKA